MARKGSSIFTRILQLVLDKDSVKKTERDTQKALKDATDPQAAEQNLGKVGAAFGKLKIGALALATALITGLALAFRKVVGESIAAQKVAAQQEAVLKSTGQAAGRTAKQLQEHANALQKVTTFTDDSISSAQNLLLTFRHLTGEEFDRATALTLDLATALGADASQAALQLGKALEDPIAGLTALRRSGVSFSESQRETIKQLVETGKRAEAQRLILAELEIQFGGSAKAARNTLGGALEGLKNAWDDLFEVSRDSSSGIIKAINGIAAALPILDSLLDKLFQGIAAFPKLLKELHRAAMQAPQEGVLLGTDTSGFGGVGAGRTWEPNPAAARDAAAAERERLEQLEEQRAALAAIAEAEKARREAEVKAQDARRRAQEEYVALLVMARNAGIATATEERQLQILAEALFATLQSGNLALEERVRLAQMLQSINQGVLDDRKVTERDAGGALAAGRPTLDGSIPLVTPDVRASERAADKTRNAWVDALQIIGAEAQIASGLVEAAFSADGFLRGLSIIADRKAKENLARAVETAAGGLAALVFGDPTKLVPAAKASAGFLAAAGLWGAVGAGGGGGGGAGFGGGGGGGFTPSTPPGRGVDRMPAQHSITIIQYIDGIDPKNGSHQTKVGQANVNFQQRRGSRLTDTSR